MTQSSFSRWRNSVEGSEEFVAEQAALRAAEEIFLAVERAGISRAELARRLGTSAPYVTKILRGGANFTLASLAKMANALDGEIKIHIASKGSRTRWIDVPMAADEGDSRFTSTARIEAAVRPLSSSPAPREIGRMSPVTTADLSPSPEPPDGNTTAAA